MGEVIPFNSISNVMASGLPMSEQKFNHQPNKPTSRIGSPSLFQGPMRKAWQVDYFDVSQPRLMLKVPSFVPLHLRNFHSSSLTFFTFKGNLFTKELGLRHFTVLCSYSPGNRSLICIAILAWTETDKQSSKGRI